MAKQLSYLIVSAIVRQGDDILLVRQQGPSDPAPSYALPGGRVEAGEVLPEALARELREETGLTLRKAGPLAYVVQLDNPNAHTWATDMAPEGASQATVFVFTIDHWEGGLTINDPDGFIQDCLFVPIHEAARLVESTVPWAVMREPLLAYLRGETSPGSLWVFRRESPEHDRLLTTT